MRDHDYKKTAPPGYPEQDTLRCSVGVEVWDDKNFYANAGVELMSNHIDWISEKF